MDANNSPTNDMALKNLEVQDEVYPDCVKIEGVVYAKDLFRLLGKDGIGVGQWSMIQKREPDGAITLLRLDDPYKKPEVA